MLKNWGKLDSSKKNDYILKYERIKNAQNGNKDAGSTSITPQSYNYGRSAEEVEEEDTEMLDSIEPPASVPGISGFTPVNRS